MKLHLMMGAMAFIIGCAVAAQDAPAPDANMEQKSLALVGEFLDQLDHKPAGGDFSYNDENKFFGDRSLVSAILLTQAGIVRQDGAWADEDPDNSLLGRLIILRKSEFGLPGATRKMIFYKDEKKDKCGYVAVILYRPASKFKSDFNVYSPVPISKTILFFITNYKQPVIDLNYSSIDGESIPFVLGIRTKRWQLEAAGKTREAEIPFLPEDTLKQLLSRPL